MKKETPKKMQDWQIEEAISDAVSTINTAAAKGPIEMIHVIIIRPTGKRMMLTFPQEDK